MRITFLPQNIMWDAEPGETILQAAVKAGISINGNCAAMGTCGKCKVKVLAGALNMEDRSHHKLTEREVAAGYRLACCHQISEGMVVEIVENQAEVSRKKQIQLPARFFVTDKTDVPAGESRKSSDAAYGVAVDIGTTTVVVMLWDIGAGNLAGVSAVTNPQTAYGADVISRITFSLQKKGNLEMMRQVLIDCINQAVEQLAAEEGIKTENISQFVIVGNTTMSHIFLGADLKGLAVAPFVPVFTESVYTTAEDVGLRASTRAQVYVAPNVAGYIGSDITAGMITTDLMKKDKGHLFIDIGTNGEIVLTGNGRAAACSTAAGPAFEGSSIRQGMRAATGAIERVDILEDRVEIGVIGDIEPVGICGSGIIDAVSELIRVGVIDQTGRILSREMLNEKGLLNKNITKHIVEADGVNNFVLYFSEDGRPDVAVTQKDIREIQLAKAAISAGTTTLMKEIGMTLESLETISIAGAFGSCIRISSAVNIGLLPKIEEEKIFSLGNAAGAGASMMLLSEAWKEEGETVARDIEHIELAARTDFMEQYMMDMNFD